MSKHAKLSASGSERWILCPGSVKAEEDLPDIPNKYAEEGTFAHQIAAERLQGILKNYLLSLEMEVNVQKYIDYINNIIAKCGKNAKFFVEKKVDFSSVVPEGFGTADFIAIDKDNEQIHIVDLKYGRGIKVNATDNTQLLLYAIGVFLETDFIDCKNITMHIVQPRLDHYSTWNIDETMLSKWSKILNNAALRALDPKAPRIPHERACKFCKAKPTCYALWDFSKEVTNDNFIKKDLTKDELKLVQDRSAIIKDFLESVEEKIYNELNQGNNFPGYKLINGRTTRKFKPESEERIVELLQDNAYEKSLIGVIKAEKLLGKDIIEELTYKVSNKPQLVKDSDSRESINNIYYFDNIEKK